MSMIPMYNTKRLNEIWTSAQDFKDEYKASGVYVDGHNISDNNIGVLFLLLNARYGSNSIANQTVELFKYKVWSLIFEYGATWERELEIQARLRQLNEDELMAGSKVINNHANHDGSAPNTAALEETQYIDAQNTTNYKRSRMEAYSQLVALLNTNVTNAFLERFKPLFRTIVTPQRTDIYVSEEENGN